MWGMHMAITNRLVHYSRWRKSPAQSTTATILQQRLCLGMLAKYCAHTTATLTDL